VRQRHTGKKERKKHAEHTYEVKKNKEGKNTEKNRDMK
jgi:hypothetical protein